MRKSVVLLSVLLAQAAAAETKYYSYDALGRLVGSYSDNTTYRNSYYQDSASNRTNLTSETVLVTLNAGQSLTSADGRFNLTMQSDGNLVIYGPSGGLWSSGTSGTAASVARMQGDGNLVLYSSSGQGVWGTGTNGNNGSVLRMQSDGNLVIYNLRGTPIWASGSGGH